MKRCPFCAEEIQDAAVVCRFCKMDLTAGRPAGAAPPQRSAGIAAILSLVIPGAGQMYNGHVGRGLAWLAAVVLGYFAFVVPGLVLHFACIIFAASGASTDASTTQPTTGNESAARPSGARQVLYKASTTRTVWVVGGLALIVILVNVVDPLVNPPKPVVQTVTEPDEPCVVDADSASARAAAQNWCEGGIFTNVSVKTSASTMTALLQFSKKGFRGWNANRLEIVNGFRKATTEISSTADMNVAISIHDPSGAMVGGCAQRRTERAPTCRP